MLRRGGASVHDSKTVIITVAFYLLALTGYGHCLKDGS